MITFINPYIEEKVWQVFEHSSWRGWKPPTRAKGISGEDLSKIECVTITNPGTISIRSSAITRIWDTDMSTHFMTLTWSSLELNYDELVKVDGYEDDLMMFSHIHSFYCDAPITIDVINSFSNLLNLGLSKMEISDWSFLLNLKNLYTISLNECGQNGNEAIEIICDLYAEQLITAKQIQAESCHVSADIDAVSYESRANLEFIAVIDMCVDDLSPFMKAREPLVLWELNLSNNKIYDVSPLYGISVEDIHLINNNIEDLGKAYSDIFIVHDDNNGLKQEDI